MAFLSIVGKATLSGEEECEFLMRLLVAENDDGEPLALRLFSVDRLAMRRERGFYDTHDMWQWAP